MKKVKNIMMIIAGNMVLAAGVILFIVPADLVVGGATGIGLLLNKLTHIHLSFFVLTLNVLFLVLGWLFEDRTLVLGSLLSSFLYPSMLSLCEMLWPSPMTSDLMLNAIVGGALSGIGVGLVFRAGASTGGTDIPCLIISHRTSLSLSQVFYLCDAVVLFGQIMIVNHERLLYALISLYISSMMIDKVITFGVNKYSVTIISERYDAICDALLRGGVGVTLQMIETGLRKEKQKAVITTIYAKQLMKVETLVEDIDENAFVSVTQVSDVKGNGFTYWAKDEPVIE